MKIGRLRLARPLGGLAGGAESTRTSFFDTVALLRRYVVQETIGPLKHLGRVLDLDWQGRCASPWVASSSSSGRCASSRPRAAESSRQLVLRALPARRSGRRARDRALRRLRPTGPSLLEGAIDDDQAGGRVIKDLRSGLLAAAERESKVSLSDIEDRLRSLSGGARERRSRSRRRTPSPRRSAVSAYSRRPTSSAAVGAAGGPPCSRSGAGR